jgi:hypothetical protein
VNEDPKRLLSEHGESDARERELLASVRRVAPPAGAKDETWRAITVQLAAGAAATAASTASTATAKVGAGSLLPGAFAGKAMLTVAAGSLAIGGYLAAQHAFAPVTPTPAPSRAPSALSAPAAHVTQPRPPPAPTPTPMAARSPTLAPASEPTPASVPGPAIRRAPSSARPDLLAAESALLTEARAQLRAGDVRAAQATLQRLRARFPHGELGQEREVLAIEVLSARGQASTARRRARAFVSAHPHSPHSATLTRFLDPP